MLEWLLYLAIAFPIGSFSFSVFSKKLWLVFISKLGTMLTKNSLKIPANSLSLLIIFPFFSSGNYCVDFIFLVKRGFTVAQNFLLSVISFRSKLSQQLLLAFLVILIYKFFCLLHFILDCWILVFRNWLVNIDFNMIMPLLSSLITTF